MTMKELAEFDIDQGDFDATYSAEDNKLRLFSAVRFDDDLYKVVKEAGFKWAPVQDLFVAPKWTPYREDLCLALAGNITAEQTTMIERAEAKSERLDNIAMKRAAQANVFHEVANVISQRFAMGQPILIGHHSEKSARRDQDRIHSAMDQAVKVAEAVQYWNWKAAGVERHANRKSNPVVRAKRIKKLLTELRDHQRDINHASLCFGLWQDIKSEEDPDLLIKRVEYYAGAHLATGGAAPYYQGDSLWSLLRNKEITTEKVIEISINHHAKQMTSVHTSRWISHILNRLAFERMELGEVGRFEGALTATILQAFSREHGAHKPKAIKQGGGWVLSSVAPLPLHIGDEKTLVLDDSKWCDLMQGCGYEVPTPKPRRKSTVTKAPLINPTLEEAK